MQIKPKNEKQARILYLAVVGVLVISALIIGLVAALGKKATPEPDVTPPVDETPTPETPDDGKTDAEPKEEPVTSYLAPATGAVSKTHDDTLPVYSATMNDFRVHQGIDIATADGADVFATARGTVSLVWSDPLMGQCLSVDHGNGVVSIYKNLSAELAEGITKDAKVTAGQKLGTVGNTALVESAEEAHLHFEMTYNGEAVDPLSYISEESKSVSFGEDTAYES
ncbi:MAG: M23 family metallopeptidase [Ruminococcaceae bacterium]|nr:M23 family metallopeptidase [Oscillospiraceae bacterium]